MFEMDKKALLEQFEAEVESSNTSLAHIMKICHFDENCNDFGSDTVHDYSIGCLNGAWWMFQRQQAKVEEQAQEIANLKSLIQGHELRHQQNLSIKQKLTRRSEELQKRVDELERMFEIKWSDEQVAPQGHSGNRIIYGDCVLGKFSIWWRTWKAWDRPGLEINDEFITEARDVEEAKQLAKQYLEQALKGENHD
ncbi:hypothetical protein ACKULE_002018 [Acinetobacter baumannii]|uniref:hypothetical protein n=3 Tax=Acinetobacter baumannii TaxID=470 RepID=UPI00259F5849|nr:hypothetical protein [Acinetobacter baumannii]EKV3533236.1 hypothetical protein [Acinetobacter baumannii]